MNTSKFPRKIATGLMAIALSCSVIVATQSPANANKRHLGTGLAIGLGLGLIAGSAHRHRDRDAHHYSVRECWWERRVRYNEYGERVIHRVKICS